MGTFTGDYVAVGALDQVIKGFYKSEATGLAKNDWLFEEAVVPAAETEYQLSIQKTGNLFILKVGDEEQLIENFTGDINYAGLFTSRNTTVTFSNVKLAIEGQIELGDWEFSAFGDNTNTTNNPPRNPEPTLNQDGSVTLLATGGKVSNTTDGISFYYKEVPAGVNFEITTKATVNSFNSTSGISTPNQKSFGLMLRDEIGTHASTGGHISRYVAVGALDTVMKGFYKTDSNVQAGNMTKLEPFADVVMPAAGQEYDLSIRKAGDTFVVTTNGQSETFSAVDLFKDEVFVGFYVARDADVTFSNFEIQVDARKVSELKVDTSEMDTEFLLGQNLNLDGLKVTAVFSDGTEQVLSDSDYIVTGFDSSVVGTNTITINYNGVTRTIELEILSLSVTELEIKYFPAKTVYYKGDKFDPTGIVIVANYEDGYKFADLSSDQYTFSISNLDGEGYEFLEAGIVEVTISSNETPETTTAFNVTVKDADLTQLDIRQLPVKMLYFIGDELDLAGINVYASYDDNSSVRLLPNEYEVSGFDSENPGTKEITLTHKSKEVTFSVSVKIKEVTNIEVADYPQTTFVVGEEFNVDGLVISKVYDNGDREVLAFGEYTINSASFDLSAAGIYDIEIVPNNLEIESIIYQVTVREEVEVEWKKMRFGQSTSNANNYVEVLEDGTIKVVALEGGGKITGDHDGIAFYYTEIDANEDNFVLSADIHVITYAKTPHDGQESFGIMARDAINPVQDASVFASNIAAVGGFSGGTRDANGTQAFVRTGVLASDGEGSQGIQKKMLKNERPTTANTTENYRLTLAKTNSGYTGMLNDGEEAIFFEPDLLNVQDSKIYVGFYAARLATIEVSNIDYTVTAAATDAPKIEPPAQPVSPHVEILSLDKTPLSEYDLIVRSNVNGTVTVRQGQTEIASEVEVEQGELLKIPTILSANSNTNFSLTFLPNDTQYLTSYAPIVRNFTVQTKTFAGGEGDIYVSPTGTNSGDGTRENPLNLDTAIEFVKPGQTIIVLEGNYVRNSKIEIKKYNDGTTEAMKFLIADPAATTRPVIDFDKRSEGVVHSGKYWHVKGIDFARSAGNTKGYTVGGSHNIIENVRLYEHGDTGLQISRTDTSENDKSQWPSYNLILNSISFDNIDPSQNNADGFAAKLTVGEGNVFDGCISHNNIDDGWDLYTKVGTGAIGPVTIKNSIAFSNGTLTNGYEGSAGKNGFKLGGEGVHVPHVIENSIAIGNGYFGFTSNSNPGLIANNNIGFNNVGANLSFSTYAHIPTDFSINGFVSYRTEGVDHRNDSYPTHLDSDNNYMFKSGASVNASGEELSNEILESLQEILVYDDQEKLIGIKRDAEGNIQWGDLWEVYNAYMGIEETAGDDNERRGKPSVLPGPPITPPGKGSPFPPGLPITPPGLNR
ncbi:bacterial Ig-like domain-containing protein [Anaerobacillus sp. CMMVII]|nr:bacterial Ig-like domain-containing protein [Anaerobacillus sp. CMMVII]